MGFLSNFFPSPSTIVEAITHPSISSARTFVDAVNPPIIEPLIRTKTAIQKALPSEGNARKHIKASLTGGIFEPALASKRRTGKNPLRISNLASGGVMAGGEFFESSGNKTVSRGGSRAKQVAKNGNTGAPYVAAVVGGYYATGVVGGETAQAAVVSYAEKAAAGAAVSAVTGALVDETQPAIPSIRRSTAAPQDTQRADLIPIMLAGIGILANVL